ncbi:hypothetical protein I7I50_00550 [Histoplasma capsulatum G186AR]|uniref:Uncharacterized protein n=1 Tax=Ajellomyces capsulatus TaxID=5037 RepID=A0A8H7YE49_AJECA|nr:hypothetical protein I7I52_07818 [Histoplasma capsulatum]QSS72638.1 hypothetical protein I7I50_00550 [Histoplasma capsulatum G186AR]
MNININVGKILKPHGNFFQMAWLNQLCSSACLAVILLVGSRFVILPTRSLNSGSTYSQASKGIRGFPELKSPVSAINCP